MSVKPDQLKIVYYPHPVLVQKAEPVDPKDPAVIAVADRMVELMHEAHGVGLAAPQVGLPWRMFVANPTGEPGPDDAILINPELTDPSDQMEEAEEGCLSLPQITGHIRRPKAITVRAYDRDGELRQWTSDQLPARIWQHETDHLDGVLILHRMSPIDRMANRKAVAELEASFKD